MIYLRSRLFRSILFLIPTVLLISLMSFSVMYFAPGDAARLLLAERLDSTHITKEQADDYAKRLGIDAGFGTLYSKWISGVIKGDFGNSISQSEPVTKVFWSKYKITLGLSLLCVLFEVLLAFPISLRAGMKPGGITDKFVSVWSVLTCSIPSFWLALIAVWVLSVHFKWKLAIGYFGIKSLIVPALIMAFLSSGNLARIIRKKSMDVMREPYIEFAHSQGLKSSQILFYHVLPHVLPTAISIVVLDMSGFLGGAILVETVFNIPGFGGLLQKAVAVKDFPLISGSLFFIGTMICSLNILADFIYPKLDARNTSEISASKERRICLEEEISK